MNYYKVLREDKTHNGMRYKEGLNMDVLPFDPTGTCRPGGMYFSSKDILAFLWVGPLVCKVTLPKNAKVYEDPGDENSDYIEKWKANKIVLGKFKEIDLDVIKGLIAEGADVHAGGDWCIQWARRQGYLDVVSYLGSLS